MSKHRHSKDKMHLTYSEMQDEMGRRRNKKMPFEQLPFYCCSLSLAPFEDPVCSPDGQVFDILYIMPFLKKYQRSPVSGKPLKPTQLIKMQWAKSENKNNLYEYQDPISYKIFTQSTHIVCIATSGYVYAYDTVNQLNKKPKYYYDLVTNQPFTLTDIITIQDPKSDRLRRLQDFDYLKNNVPFIAPQKLEPEITPNETIDRIRQQIGQKKKEKRERDEIQIQQKIKKKRQLEAREDMKGFIQWAIEHKVYKHERETDNSSASLTSTNFTPKQSAQMNFRELKVSEIRDKVYAIVREQKMKGLVQIFTNLGNMNFLIHCNLVPKTSENFIELAESGYYDDTEFHRLVKNHCLQGGDPSATGSGGESIFGKQFEDEFHSKLTHSKLGILSMANSGPDTNQSQFFITLGQQMAWDQRHSVFGEILSNEALLVKINEDYCSKSQRPKHPIKIVKIYCYDNPFRKAIKQLKEQFEELSKNREKEIQEKSKERWLEDSEKFSLPFRADDKKGKQSLSNQLLQSYYQT